MLPRQGVLTLCEVEIFQADYAKGILRLQLHDAIYRPDSFALMLRYCVNLKAIRYESTSLNRIVADKSHRVIVALFSLNVCLEFFIVYFH